MNEYRRHCFSCARGWVDFASWKCWRYFCGCCYRRLEERQEIAREKLDAEDLA